MTNWGELSELRRKWLALIGRDAIEVHGWLIGMAVAMERRRGANPADTDSLIAELRASEPPQQGPARGPDGTRASNVSEPAS